MAKRIRNRGHGKSMARAMTAHTVANKTPRYASTLENRIAVPPSQESEAKFSCEALSSRKGRGNWTGAPCSHQRTWAENVGAKPLRSLLPIFNRHPSLFPGLVIT